MPGRRTFIRVAFALAGLGFLSPPAAAQTPEHPALSAGYGPAFLLKPRWFQAGNRAFAQGWGPSFLLRLTWPSRFNNRLQFSGFARNGWWATESVSSYRGRDEHWAGQVYQLGTGLRYTDFLNLGRWLDPFVGLTASAGYVATGQSWMVGAARVRPSTTPRRWSAQLGAELGLRAWVDETSSPTLTLEVYRSLQPYFGAPLVETAYTPPSPTRPAVPYEVRTRALRGQSAVLLGRHWRLGCHVPRQRWRTPRASESAPPQDDANDVAGE